MYYMNAAAGLESLTKQSFYLLNGMPSYLGLEQRHSIESKNFSPIVEELLSIGLKKHLNRVSIHLRKGTDTFLSLALILEERGFKHFTTSVEYKKNLLNEKKPASDFSYFTLNDSIFTEIEFKNFWESVMQGSGNQRSTLSMDEHLNSVENELGTEWKRNCGVFYMKERPVAVCIPHIEPGTEDEGRLFYFGLLPDERGKGYASELHQYSLYLLKEMGAAYYIGSTHETNKAMQRIFEKSGCKESGRRSSYYYYFNEKKDEQT